MSILRALMHAVLLWALLRFGLGQVGLPSLPLWLALVAGALAGGALPGLTAGAVIVLFAVLADSAARAALTGLAGAEGLADGLPYLVGAVAGLVASPLAGAVGAVAEHGAPSGAAAEPSVAKEARAFDALVSEGRADEAAELALNLGWPRAAHDLLVRAKRPEDARSVLRHAGLVESPKAPGGSSPGPVAAPPVDPAPLVEGEDALFEFEDPTGGGDNGPEGGGQ